METYALENVAQVSHTETFLAHGTCGPDAGHARLEALRYSALALVGPGSFAGPINNSLFGLQCSRALVSSWGREG